jgi:hypothetical protein
LNYDEIGRACTAEGVIDEALFAEAVVTEWVREYRRETRGDREIVEIDGPNNFTYIYDSTMNPPRDEADNRVIGAWGRATPATQPRDKSRMRGYPSPQRQHETKVDRGHLIAHAIGGEYDMNLIPQDSALNQGKGGGDRRWRELERYCERHPGTLLFVRALYEDITDHPAKLEYVIVLEDRSLRVEQFLNDSWGRPGSPG